MRDMVPPTLATWAIAMLFLLAFGPAHYDAAVLKERGVDATATVTGITRHSGSGRSSPSYHLQYRFRVGSGWADGERILRNGEEDRVRGRRQVPIIYDPEDRSRSTLNFDDAVRLGHPDIEFALGVLAALGALASFWWLFLSMPRRRPIKSPDRL